MKYFASAIVLLALFGNEEQVNAIRINQKAAFTDDLVKSLAEEMQKDVDDTTETATAASPVAAIHANATSVA
jgi:energy-converting hydrogenase A subunit M